MLRHTQDLPVSVKSARIEQLLACEAVACRSTEISGGQLY